MKNTTLLTFVMVTIFTTSSVFGQNTNAKDTTTAAARNLANQLTTQAIETQLNATKARQKAQRKLKSATKALDAAKAHVEALTKTRAAIATADTEAEEALETWQTAADELAKAVADDTTPNGILSGMETDEREGRVLKVSTEATLKALIVTAHETFEGLEGTDYEPVGATPAEVDAALAAFLTTANADVGTKRKLETDAQTAFDKAVAALRQANADFIAAGGLQSRYKALDVKSPSRRTSVAKPFTLPKSVVANLAAQSKAIMEIASQLETLNTNVVRSVKAAEAIGPAIKANTTATTLVAAAVNANTARILSKEQLLQAQAHELARSVLDRLSKVDPESATRFSHLTTIVVLKNPDLASKVKLLKTIEKRLEQGASRKQLKEIIELLERFAPKPVSQK